jgi:hypothetical protein
MKQFLLILILVASLLVANVIPKSRGVSITSAEAQDASRPSARLGHCLIYDEQRHQILLLSGYQPPNQPEFDELWGWNGVRWERIPGSGPVARGLSGAVYDSRRKRVVLFGGVGNKGYEELKGDTWEWDEKTWRQMADTSVGTRDHHVMVYDEARGKTVMYGGQTSARTWATDTWEWDGERWAKTTTPGPGGRAHFAMAYDSKRKRVVLFGGLGDDNKYHNDTWEWDGSKWAKVSDEGPPPRARHRMVYDSKAGVVVLFGGDGVKAEPGQGFRVLDDTWTWDGKRWTEIKTPGPGKRMMPAMAYDSARGRTVLYGGGDGQTRFDDTWEWDGKSWKQIK